MKTSLLLIAKKTSDANRLVAQAARDTDRNFKHINDSRRAFQLLRAGLCEIDLVILDVDPGMHGMAILEALAGCKNAPPVIVLTGFEEHDMTPIAHAHGATACIAKPFSTRELSALIEQVCPAMTSANSCPCDRWGHPHRCRRQVTRQCASGYQRRTAGAAGKFAAAFC